jgi:hypothetical protein
MSKEQLEKALNNGDIEGDEAQIPPPGGVYDFSSGECPLVIIKGVAIVPISKQKTTEWEV